MVLSGVPTQWAVRGSGGGGSLFSPQISPYNPAEYYVSSDMGQLFHSTNAGASWQTVDFRQIQGAEETRVQYTENPSILYALDYSTVAGVDNQRPATSTDGGQTWHPLANDPTGSGAFYFFADPANHNRLVIADYTDVYFSADGGQTWAQKYSAKDPGAGIVLGGAFWDGTNIYLGTNDGILTSKDGGQSFAVANVGGIATGSVIRSFAGARQGGTVRFVAVTAPSADVYGGVQGWDNNGGTAVYTLDLGAANWTRRALPSSAWPFFADMALNNTSTMYVGGGSVGGTPTVYRSTDGGGTWQSVLLTAGNLNVQTGWSGSGGDRDWYYGETAMGFTVDPADATRVMITDYGFAHVSTDGGATWKALYVAPADLNPAGANTPRGKPYHDSGLDNTTSWQVAWADASHVVLANSDIRGQLSSDGGQTFGFGYTGQTYNTLYRVAAGANGVLYGAAGSVHDLYQSTTLTDSAINSATGAVLFSADKGVTWQTLHNFNHEVSWVATDPANPDRLYASVANSSSGGIYVTNNLSAGASSTWTKLTAPPRTQGHPLDVVVLNDGTLVVSYSGRRDSSGAFTASSGVFMSTDGGSTWQDRSATGMKYWTWDVVVDPSDPTQSTWYAGVFSGWGGAPNGLGGLYKTTNRGVSWTRVLILSGVTSATFNPADPNEVFVTSETDGLYYSNTIRSSTPTFTQVASYPFRQPERVFFNPYDAGEIWVTSFGGGVMVGTTAPAAPYTAPVGTLQLGAQTYSVNEGAGVQTITVNRVGGSAGSVSVQYASADGTAVAPGDYTPVSGTLTWADGDTAPKTVTVPIVDDPLVEGDETFSVVLSNPGGGATLDPSSTAVVTIVDNDVAPAVTSTSPASGATGVATTAPVKATFSEPVQTSALAFTLKDAAGNAVAGSVAYDPTTMTVTLAPSSPLAASTTYTAALSGATDAAGNAMAPLSWSFATAAAATSSPGQVWYVDNSTTGSYSETGSGWRTGQRSVGYLGHFRTHVAGTGTDTATWKLAGLPVGSYEVYVTWPSLWTQNRASNAPYTIYDATAALGTVRVNQMTQPNDVTDGGVGWKDMGDYQVSSGTLRVVLTDDADGRIMADAIRVVSLPGVSAASLTASTGYAATALKTAAVQAPGSTTPGSVPHASVTASTSFTAPVSKTPVVQAPGSASGKRTSPQAGAGWWSPAGVLDLSVLRRRPAGAMNAANGLSTGARRLTS